MVWVAVAMEVVDQSDRGMHKCQGTNICEIKIHTDGENWVRFYWNDNWKCGCLGNDDGNSIKISHLNKD